jgi:hypothetical protein
MTKEDWEFIKGVIFGCVGTTAVVLFLKLLERIL